MTHVTINDQPMDVPAGTTVLQATRMAGVDIPTLCDHPSLRPYGGCRLCVVEIQGFRTLQASCTMPVSEGMVIRTDSPKVRKAREFVLTLLFSERNHFCMYCQKTDGDCELQNAAYGEGMTHWPLQPNWKPYLVDASHPYFVFDHNRCILCRRCIRACAELAGNFTLNMENRGASSMVVADYGLPMGESSCIKCGSCLQVCPTGALIDRESAYLGRNADAEHIRSICVGCSVGCGIEMVVRDNHLIRIDGDWEAPVNAGVLCETGRFQAFDDDETRVSTPLVRKNGSLEPVSWDEAIETLAARLAPLAGRNGDGLAALASTRLPAEALYAFKALFAGRLNSSMVTSIEESSTSTPDTILPVESSLEALKAADCVVVIGADLVESHQVAGFFIKRNLPKGTRLIVIDPFDNGLSAAAHYALQPKPGSDGKLLEGLMLSIVNLGLNREAAPTAFDLTQVSLAEVSETTGIPRETIVAVAREIASADQPVFVFGKGLTHRQSVQALQTLQSIARMVGAAAVINPRGKANSLAAARYELNQPFIPNGYQAVYLALGDDVPTPRLSEYLKDVPFLAVQTAYASPLTERADVVLPVETWSEQEGHYLNLEGRLQHAYRGVQPSEDVRSNLDVLQSLAGCLGGVSVDGWQEALLEQVGAEKQA